jgi:hypothetical protein
MKIPTRRSVTMSAMTAVLMAGTSLVYHTLSPAQEVPPPTPFFSRVQPHIVAGLVGDLASLETGMKDCEAVLTENPDHAQALLWHGIGLTILAQRASVNDERQELLERGLREMDRALVLAPQQLPGRREAILAPRAAALSAVVPWLPDELRDLARDLTRSAVDGFEQTLAIQTPYFSQMSIHRRGELLGGLAENWWRLGATAKARVYLERMVKELPNSAYGTNAQGWLENASTRPPLTCLSCHP